MNTEFTPGQAVTYYSIAATVGHVAKNGVWISYICPRKNTVVLRRVSRASISAI
jgi:hypothetical protein